MPSLPTPAISADDAGLHDVEQRHDGGRREIDVLQLAARFVEGLAEQHRDQLQMRGQPTEFRLGQRGEDMVLIGIVRR